jgi:hypothetical protein
MSQTLKKNKDIQGKQELLLVSLNNFYLDSKNKDCIINILNGDGKISLRIIDWFVTNYAKKHNIEYLIKTRIVSPKKSHTLKKNNLNSRLSKKDLSKYTSAHKQINIFLSYKAQLRAYSKKQFDPFCRRNRIDFYFNETEYITTTVGQLNFFRWALQNNVIDYIVSHYTDIENDMNDNTKKQRLYTKQQKTKHKLNNIQVEVKEEIISELNVSNLSEMEEPIDLSSVKKERKKRKPLSVAATNNMNKNNVPVLLNFD